MTGSLEGRIFQHRFRQDGSTAGRSPDEISIQFGKSVWLHGIHTSIDCWKDTRLVEFAGGINQKPAYVTNTDKTMLFHVSFATTKTAGAIDRTFWFPKPFQIRPDDKINIGAWIQNISPKERFVSPEFILYFTWGEESTPSPPSPSKKPRSKKVPPAANTVEVPPVDITPNTKRKNKNAF